MLQESKAKPIVFFDGGCPLCKKEINHYQRVDTDSSIEWVDIYLNPERLSDHNIELNAAMERLHSIHSDGTTITGVASFLLIWENLPRYKKIASVIKALKLEPLSEFIYTRFAAWRIRKRCNDQCSPISRN
ncbi:thiol-disulfide oxidoreductase DCC family protein [Neptuniibacter sp. PT34_22]|uniref:thiol-disulfide oxidoreductase DCC family protein n=1 Tax=Neptuniibacter sp. PT34_22 TaxID=3398205 RepID=UPI0039F5B330